MPEVTIGLFPDAGASWILKGLSSGLAAWLGMTGTHMMAADALHIGLGTHAIPAAAWSTLVDGLTHARWQGGRADTLQIEALYRARAASRRCPTARWPGTPRCSNPRSRRFRRRSKKPPRALTELSGRDEWIDKGLATMRSGCPASVGIVHEQLRRVGSMSLADTFRMELNVANHCARNPDFAEGVRALIIDKDNKPAWRYGSLRDLPHDYVTAHFETMWPTHPLADLGDR